MRDRVRPPADLEQSVLDRLKSDGIVETKQKGMMLAAAIGFHFSAESASEGKELDRAGEGIRLEYFQRARDAGFIDALAVTRSGDLHVLNDNYLDRRIELFEKYAHAGLLELQRVCYGGHETPLDALLRLIDRTLAKPSDELPGLEELSRLGDLV